MQKAVGGRAADEVAGAALGAQLAVDERTRRVGGRGQEVTGQGHQQFHWKFISIVSCGVTSRDQTTHWAEPEHVSGRAAPLRLEPSTGMCFTALKHQSRTCTSDVLQPALLAMVMDTVLHLTLCCTHCQK